MNAPLSKPERLALLRTQLASAESAFANCPAPVGETYDDSLEREIRAGVADRVSCLRLEIDAVESETPTKPPKFRLTRVYPDDFSGPPLWSATTNNGPTGLQEKTMLVRARRRNEAKELVRAENPGARFFK